MRIPRVSPLGLELLAPLALLVTLLARWYGLASVCYTRNLRIYARVLLEFDARLHRAPMAVRTRQHVSVGCAVVDVGVLEQIDNHGRDADGAVEAVARASVAIALDHGAGHLEQAVWTVPIQRLLDHTARTAYLQAVFAVEQVFERVQGVVGARVPRVERLFVVVGGGQHVRGFLGRRHAVAVEAVACVVRVGECLCHVLFFFSCFSLSFSVSSSSPAWVLRGECAGRLLDKSLGGAKRRLAAQCRRTGTYRAA